MSKINDFLNGRTIESTKLVTDLPTILPTEIKIKNSKGYYYAILVLDLFLWVMILRPKNGEIEIVGLFQESKWFAIGILAFLTWGLGLMIYRIFIDTGDKLIIDTKGIRGNNIIDKVNIGWGDIGETNLYIGAKSTHKLLIKTKLGDDHEIFIANLDKSPKEIGHYVELFKRHYAQHCA